MMPGTGRGFLPVYPHHIVQRQPNETD